MLLRWESWRNVFEHALGPKRIIKMQFFKEIFKTRLPALKLRLFSSGWTLQFFSTRLCWRTSVKFLNYTWIWKNNFFNIFGLLDIKGWRFKELFWGVSNRYLYPPLQQQRVQRHSDIFTQFLSKTTLLEYVFLQNRVEYETSLNKYKNKHT